MENTNIVLRNVRLSYVHILKAYARVPAPRRSTKRQFSYRKRTLRQRRKSTVLSKQLKQTELP